MSLRFIIGSWLADNGFDGLVNLNYECGCSKNDLAPCDYPNLDECFPAFKHGADPEETDSGFNCIMKLWPPAGGEDVDD